MKLIGAGYARTGTLSTKAGLETLGLRCYHMADVIGRPEHLQQWYDFVVAGKPMDWKRLFEGYDASVDFPAALYHHEILEAFPEARVLLNVRDPERWFESFRTHVALHRELAPGDGAPPRFARFLELLQGLNRRAFGPDVSPLDPDRETCMRAFREHNESVRAELPPERLLVFGVEQGWDPLCEFLSCDAPVDTPFPHLNEGPDTVRAVLQHVFLDPN